VFVLPLICSRSSVSPGHPEHVGRTLVGANAYLGIDAILPAIETEADVVITNPTHFAIALKYEPDSMQAPRVVAKGADQIAFKMREIAEANDVPVVENPPLTRALYQSVDLDQEIPPEHYRAVAEVIGYVMRLKGRLPAGRAKRGA